MPIPDAAALTVAATLATVLFAIYGSVERRIREEFRTASAGILKRAQGVTMSIGIGSLSISRPAGADQLVALADGYAANVPVLFPRFRSRQSSSDSFSWHLYWKHHEYNAALGTLFMVAALVAKSIWLR